MSPFAWSPDLDIGVPLVDAQHRALVERTAALLDSLKDGAADEASVEALAFLSDYVVVHFEAEELLMESVGYPSLGEHRTEHDDFRRRVDELRRQFVVGGSGAELTKLVRQDIRDWIVSHVRLRDADIGRHLRANETEATARG